MRPFTISSKNHSNNMYASFDDSLVEKILFSKNIVIMIIIDFSVYFLLATIQTDWLNMNRKKRRRIRRINLNIQILVCPFYVLICWMLKNSMFGWWIIIFNLEYVLYLIDVNQCRFIIIDLKIKTENESNFYRLSFAFLALIHLVE